MCIALIFQYNLVQFEYMRNRSLKEDNLEKQSGIEDTGQNAMEEVVLRGNKNEIKMAEDVVMGILHKLSLFERSYKFSERPYTLSMLAKELKTNRNYLSRIVNIYKGSSFTSYMNNLKIDFAIERLTSDKSLRSYTIEAIAEEMGFNRAQSFSTSFRKRTGMYPSYYIKKLNDM